MGCMSSAPFGAAVILGFACISVCAAESADAPRFVVGDTWSFEVLDEHGRQTGTFVETVRELPPRRVAIERVPGPDRLLRLTEVMNPFNANNTVVERVRFPMAVGAKWSAEFDWKSGANAFGTDKMGYEVLAHEEIDTAAGRLNAYKISANGWSKNKSVITPVGGDTKVSETYWYAPAVKRIVEFDGKALKWVPPQFVVTNARRYRLLAYKVE